jgi:hypothetical protein
VPATSLIQKEIAMGNRCCLTNAPDHHSARTLPAGPCAAGSHDPASLTAPTVAVWSAYGRLLWAALPVETARQWVARGEASVEAPHTIRFDPKEENHA